MNGPILLIDNEYENVSDLERMLRSACAITNTDAPHVQYCESAEEGLTYLAERLNEGRFVSAIITDNHLDGLEGEDFLRLVRGHLAYCYHPRQELAGHSIDFMQKFKTLPEFKKAINATNKYYAVEDTLTESFDANYGRYVRFSQDFAAHMEQQTIPLIMYCGRPNEIKHAGLQGVTFIQKDHGSTGVSEDDVLAVLNEAGVFDEEAVLQAKYTHPYLNPFTPKKVRAYDFRRKASATSHHQRKLRRKRR